MDAVVAGFSDSNGPRASALVGRTFVSPLVDYLFIGAGISIPVFAVLYFAPWMNPVGAEVPFAIFIAINGAHFAASTVRLYTKPGARAEFPFLIWVFPIICFAVATLGLYVPRVGGQIEALYFTWSPYHYAAQTYGLAVMYAMRSGARLDQRDKQQIWLVCMLPFVHAFFTTQMGGLFWFVPRDVLLASPVLDTVYRATVMLLRGAVFLLPLALFWQMHRMRGRNVPLISLLLQVTNGMWWIGSDYLNAWFWTAIFHSVQYLIIVTVRHVDEQVPRGQAAGRTRAAIVHGTGFYGMSLVVGFMLFVVAPAFYATLGFRGLRSFAMITFVINLHHFIVDGFIWRTPPRTSKGTGSLDPVTMPA